MKHRPTQPMFQQNWLIVAIKLLVFERVLSLNAQTAKPIIYTVKFPAPAIQVVEVEARVPTAKRTIIELLTPIWLPGFFRVEDS